MTTTNPAARPTLSVTLEDIENNIEVETYFTVDQGMAGKAMMDAQASGQTGESQITIPGDFRHVTLCVILMTNGTKIVGVNYGPVLPSDFDAEMGRQLARKHAVDQMYPLLNFALREAVIDVLSEPYS